MWKHKLQEALDGMDALPSIIKEARAKLDEAVCISLGNAEGYKPIANALNKANVPAICPSDFRLPYDSCLFEADVPSEGGNHYRVFCLIYKENIGTSHSITCFIATGAGFNDVQYSQQYGIVRSFEDEMIIKDCVTEHDVQDKDASQSFVCGCSIAHIILLLLSCKNIVETTIPAPTRLNKKRILKNKLPICEYKVLGLWPMSQGRASKQSLHGPSKGLMRVHLCRGHFKDYTPEKPLFGKVTGRIWWQPAVRGEKSRGVIVKDYQFKG